jgi:hypothetical protein
MGRGSPQLAPSGDFVDARVSCDQSEIIVVGTVDEGKADEKPPTKSTSPLLGAWVEGPADADGVAYHDQGVVSVDVPWRSKRDSIVMYYENMHAEGDWGRPPSPTPSAWPHSPRISPLDVTSSRATTSCTGPIFDRWPLRGARGARPARGRRAGVLPRFALRSNNNVDPTGSNLRRGSGTTQVPWCCARGRARPSTKSSTASMQRRSMSAHTSASVEMTAVGKRSGGSVWVTARPRRVPGRRVARADRRSPSADSVTNAIEPRDDIGDVNVGSIGRSNDSMLAESNHSPG